MHVCCRFNRKDISFYDICGLQELNAIVLTKLLVLQLQVKMQFRFSQDDLLFASIFFQNIRAIIINQAPSCLYPCL